AEAGCGWPDTGGTRGETSRDVSATLSAIAALLVSGIACSRDPTTRVANSTQARITIMRDRPHEQMEFDHDSEIDGYIVVDCGRRCGSGLRRRFDTLWNTWRWCQLGHQRRNGELGYSRRRRLVGSWRGISKLGYSRRRRLVGSWRRIGKLGYSRRGC